jgi:hypothetical protein
MATLKNVAIYITSLGCVVRAVEWLIAINLKLTGRNMHDMYILIERYMFY